MTVISKRSVRSLVLGVLLAVVGSSTTFIAPPARAQVVCVNCADIFTQIFEYAEQLLQGLKQIQQYQLQISQFEDQVRNSIKIPTGVFDNALSTIRNIEQTMNYGNNIRYTMANIEDEFRRLYPDTYETYTQLQNARDIWESMDRDWYRLQQGADSARSALMAARQQSIDMQNDQDRMDDVASHLIDASGRLDAMQAAGEYAQMSAQQLMKLRQVALLQTQMMANVQADQMRQENLRRAAQQIWIEDRPAEAAETPNASSDYVR